MKSLENWFRKVLEVNPMSRGGTECLHLLKSIVDTRTVNVFNMSTSKSLSYFVEEVDVVRKLEHQLMTDTQTGSATSYDSGTAMFLLLEDGQLLTSTAGPATACKVRGGLCHLKCHSSYCMYSTYVCKVIHQVVCCILQDGPMGHVFLFSEQQICIRFCSNNERPIQKISKHTLSRCTAEVQQYVVNPVY